MDEEIYPKSRFTEPDRIPDNAPPHPVPSAAKPPEGDEPDRMPGPVPGSPPAATLASRKWLLFALLGFCGGGAGTVLGGLAPGFGKEATLAEICFKTGIWSALVGGPLAVALFWANDIYRHRKLGSTSVGRGLLSGVIGGLLAGAFAELLFQKIASPGDVSMLIYGAAWSALGLLLGLALSRSVPNMGYLRGAVAGLLGGALGGGGFAILVGIAGLPELIARLAGTGILGASLGLAIVVVDKLFREAALEVFWSPFENSFFNLGSDPIRIGGGADDEIYVRGLAPGFACFTFTAGLIEYVECESGSRTALKDKSSLQIGSLRLIIHAGS